MWSSVSGQEGGVRLSLGPRLTPGKPDSLPAWGIKSLPCRDLAARHGLEGRAPAQRAQLLLLIVLMEVKQGKVKLWVCRMLLVLRDCKGKKKRQKKKKKAGNLCTWAQYIIELCHVLKSKHCVSRGWWHFVLPGPRCLQSQGSWSAAHPLAHLSFTRLLWGGRSHFGH